MLGRRRQAPKVPKIPKVIAAAALSAILVTGACGGGGGSTPKPKTTAARIARSQAILQDFVKGKYADIRKGFSDQLQSALDQKTMVDTWKRFVNDFGTYKSHGKSSEVTSGPYKVVDVPLVMSKHPGVLRVGYDPDGLTSGLFLLQPGVAVGSEGALGTPTPALATAATTVVEQMRTGDFDALGKSFNPSMAAQTNPGDIGKAWNSAVAEVGAYQSQGQPLVVAVPGAVLYDIPVTMAKGPIHVQVVIDPQGKVAGISIRAGAPTGTFGK